MRVNLLQDFCVIMKKEEIFKRIAALIKAYPDAEDEIKKLVEALLSIRWEDAVESPPYLYKDLVSPVWGINLTEQVLTRLEDNSYNLDNMQEGQNGWFWVEEEADNKVTHWMIIPDIPK